MLAHKIYTSITTMSGKGYMVCSSICEERNTTSYMIKIIKYHSVKQSMLFLMKKFLLLKSERYFAHMPSTTISSATAFSTSW